LKKKRNISELPLDVKAKMALKEAVAEVIRAHRRSGQPLAIWREGRVVMLPPDQATIVEEEEDAD
jgi:hypothetical protein